MHNSEFDNIEIPENIDLYIKKGVKKAVREKKSKRNKFKKIAVCAGIMGVLLLSFNIDSFASKIPFVKDVYKEIRHSKEEEVITINFNEYFEDSVQKINKTVTANGKTVTAESVLCDGKYIAISYIVKSQEKFYIDKFGHQLRSNCKIKINNTDDYEFNSCGIEGTYTDDYTFVGGELLLLENKESLPTEFDMNVVFDNIDGEFCEKERGYVPENVWEFNFKVKSDTSNNKVIKVNDTKSKFTVSSVEVRPLSLIINHKRPGDTKDTMYNVIVYDDKGNIVNEREEMTDKNQETKSVYKAVNRDCKYLKIVYCELELIPNPTAPGTMGIEKENVDDVVFKIDLD